MTIAVTPVTAADGTFSSSGSAAWAAGMTITQATARLLGRATAGAGATEEITLGTNLSFTGTTLNAAGGASLDAITAAAGAATIASGNNTGIVWNWANTTNTTVAFTFGETSAATNGTSTNGIPNQVLLKATTLAASTQSPFLAVVRGTAAFGANTAFPQLLLDVGQSSNPSVAFFKDVKTGFYTSQGPDLTIVVNGSDRVQFGSSNLIMLSTTQIIPKAGTAASPGIADATSNNSGFFMGSGFVAISTTGVENMRFVGTGANTAQQLWAACTFANLGTPANGSFAYCSDCDPGTLFNSTCTSAGTKTGAFARRVNGVWECD